MYLNKYCDSPRTIFIVLLNLLRSLCVYSFFFGHFGLGRHTMAETGGEWSLSTGVRPIFWSIILPFTWLVVVSFPDHVNRWTGLSMVLAAGFCAWQTATELSPDRTLNEVYIRYILIGTSHAAAMVYKNPRTGAIPNHVRIIAMLIFLDPFELMGSICSEYSLALEKFSSKYTLLFYDSYSHVSCSCRTVTQTHDTDWCIARTNIYQFNMEPMVRYRSISIILCV